MICWCFIGTNPVVIYVSLWTKSLDQPTNMPLPGATLLAWLKIWLFNKDDTLWSTSRFHFFIWFHVFV